MTIDYKEFLYKVIILEQYKGKKVTDTITIVSGTHSCGAFFNEGGNFLIFAVLNPKNIYGTGQCLGNRMYNDNDHSMLLKLAKANR